MCAVRQNAFVISVNPIESGHDVHGGYSRDVTEHDHAFEPLEKHVAADRAGKTLLNLAGAINKAVGAEDEPIVVNRKGRHVSIKELEDLIDKALEG
jgi:hypothetical protein